MRELSDFSAKVHEIRQRSDELWFCTPAQASAALVEARRMTQDLTLLKRDLVARTRELRSGFQADRARVTYRMSMLKVLLRLLRGARAVGRYNAASREDIRQAQIETLAPFEAVSREADAVLVGLDRLKLMLERRAKGQA